MSPTDSAPPTLAAVEDLARRYGILVKWAVLALVFGTIWVTSVTIRLGKVEEKVDAVVERLDPVRDALIRIEARLGIEQEKPK